MDSPENVMAVLGIEISDDLYCPITKILFKSPVVTSDGITYEKRNIKKWLLKSFTSPLTRNQISTSLYPNMIIKRKCDEIREKVFLKGMEIASKFENDGNNDMAIKMYEYVFDITNEVGCLKIMMKMYENIDLTESQIENLELYALTLSYSGKESILSSKIFSMIGKPQSFCVNLYPCLHSFPCCFLKSTWSQDFDFRERCPYCGVLVEFPNVYMGGVEILIDFCADESYEEQTQQYREGAFNYVGSYRDEIRNSIVDAQVMMTQIREADIFIYCLTPNNLDKFLIAFSTFRRFGDMVEKNRRCYLLLDPSVKKIPQSFTDIVSYIYEFNCCEEYDFYLGIEVLSKFKSCAEYWKHVSSWYKRTEWKHVVSGNRKRKLNKL
jgi:hypothetical protein